MRKIHLLLFSAAAVALLAAGCSKKAVQYQNPQPQPQSDQQQTASTAPPGQNQARQNAGSPDYFPNGQTPGGVAKAPAITVSQSVQGSNLNKPSDVVPEGETALDLLKRDHKVETKAYGGIGEFVQSIDGISPDAQHFWTFYVNGVSSNVGAASYKPKDGDKIEWKISKIGDYNK